MQLQVAQATLRDMIGTRGGGGTWDDTTCTRYINMAQRLLWRQILTVNPGVIAVDESYNYAANATSNSLVSAGTFSIETILAAYSMQAAGAISTTNIPMPMYPVEMVDIENNNQTEQPFESSIYRTGYRYAIYAQTHILIRPIPQAALPIVVRMIKVPTDLSGATDEIWGGKLPGMHDIVLFRAARLASTKVKEASGQWKAFEEEAWSHAVESLSGSVQTSMQVRHVDAPLS